MILTLGYCGIRWAEASAIKTGRCRCRRGASGSCRTTRTSAGAGSGAGKEPREAVRALPRSFADELGTLARGKGPGDLLFAAPEGGPLRYNNFRSRVFDPAVKEAGLGGLGITPHKLRHTAASLAIAAGADVLVVKTMLGHKDAAMTLNVYGHLFSDRLDEVADALDVGRKVALALRDASLVSPE